MTGSVHWAEISSFPLKTGKESGLRNVVFYIPDRTVDNIQNCDRYINIPLSHAYREH
jgi:hypothetical protein